MPDQFLHGRHILVVEDEYYLADELTQHLRKAGATVLGPCASVSQAIPILEGAAPHGAVLDVNLHGQMVYTLADRLAEDAIPFVFTTGYDASILPERFAAVPIFGKPFDADRIAAALHGLLRPDAP